MGVAFLQGSRAGRIDYHSQVEFAASCFLTCWFCSLSVADESTFHFLPMLGPSTSASGKNAVSGLCLEVPALLGLNSTTGRQAANKGIQLKSSVHRPANNSANNGGFYKRLLEWLSRKKKTHRRYSEFPMPSDSCQVDVTSDDSHHLAVAVSSVRNQSAPMIFNIHRPSRLNGHVDKLEKLSSQSAVDEECVDTCRSRGAASEMETPHIVTRQDSEDKMQEIDAEWIIPWNDIQVGQPITHGRSCTINRY